MNSHNIAEILGWIANIILIVGNWNIGNRKRWAFLVIAFGEAIWLYVSYTYDSTAMMFICAVFGAIAVRNWENFQA